MIHVPLLSVDCLWWLNSKSIWCQVWSTQEIFCGTRGCGELHGGLNSLYPPLCSDDHGGEALHGIKRRNSACVECQGCQRGAAVRIIIILINVVVIGGSSSWYLILTIIISVDDGPPPPAPVVVDADIEETAEETPADAEEAAPAEEEPPADDAEAEPTEEEAADEVQDIEGEEAPAEGEEPAKEVDDEMADMEQELAAQGWVFSLPMTKPTFLGAFLFCRSMLMISIQFLRIS